LYQLLFELEQGTRYTEFISQVPEAAFARGAADVVKAIRRLGLIPTHRKARWDEVLTLEVPFLARNNTGVWLLYRVREGNLQRLVLGEEKAVPVAKEEFTSSWTGDLITAAKPTAEELEKAPRIVFQEATHDFGKLWQGDVVDHVFAFRNDGKSTLVITDIRATCGCTAAVVSRDATSETKTAAPSPGTEFPFEPGESGFLKVTFNTAGKRLKTESSVKVFSNDPRNPLAEIRVSAGVRVPLEVIPPTAYFGRVSKGSALTRNIRITSMGDPAFTIIGATCPNPRVGTEVVLLQPQDPSADTIEYVLKVTLDIDGIGYGVEIKDRITVQTSSQKSPTIMVGVQALVSGELFLTPSPLYITPLYPNRDITRFVTLMNNGSRNVKVLDVRSDIPGFSFTIEPVKEGKQYRIKGLLKVEGKPGSIEGEIVVLTDHPTQPELRVPVTSTLPGADPLPSAAGTGSGR